MDEGLKTCIIEWIKEIHSFEGPHDLLFFMIKHKVEPEALPELIAAYENQGELLRLSLANVDRLNDEICSWRDGALRNKSTHDDLRKQLAEAKLEIRKMSEERWERQGAPIGQQSEHENERDNVIADLRKQLAEVQTELDEASKDQVQSAKAYEDTWKELQTYIKLWKETIKQRDEAQAECERLRNMRGFTPDASRDK